MTYGVVPFVSMLQYPRPKSAWALEDLTPQNMSMQLCDGTGPKIIISLPASYKLSIRHGRKFLIEVLSKIINLLLSLCSLDYRVQSAHRKQ